MGYRGIRSALVASVALYAVSAAPAQAQTRSFNVPAQSAVTGIPELARQADVQILVSEAAVRGKSIKAVRGSMTVADALRRALRGTGLTFSSTDGRTFTLTASRAGTAATVQEANVNVDTGATPEILVVGMPGWTLNTDIKRTRDDAQPYVVFDADQIKRSGATNLEDFFRDNVNQDAGGIISAANVNPNAQTGRISLRGLGPDETLILIDGRRIAPTNTGSDAPIGQPQITGIPLGAIERIEILPSSASGIYGGSATGGVVNIVMKRDYKGLEVNATYGSTYEGAAPTRQVDVAAGSTLFGGGTNVMITGTWQKTDPFYLEDAPYIVGYMNRTLATTNVTTPPLGATPNIRSSNGANLTLDPAYGGTSLGSAITSVPYGFRGVAQDGVAGLVANAGKYNLDLADNAQLDRGRRNTILTGGENFAATIAIRQEVTPWLRLFAEAAGNENRGISVYNVTNQVTIAAAAPNNPFQQNIIVTFPVLNTNLETEYKRRGLRLTGGAILKLPFGWSGSADYSWNKTWFDRSEPRLITNAQRTSFANGSIDVLRDLAINPITYDLGEFGSFASRNPSVTQTYSLRLAGPLPLQLPGGKPTVTVQLQRTLTDLPGTANYLAQGTAVLTSFSATSTISYYPARSSKADSGYFEARIPLFGPANHIAFLHSLEFQVAGRYERYTITGPRSNVNCYTFTRPFTAADLDLPCPTATTVIPPSGSASRESFNPTYSIKWQPAADLTLRGSFASGYRPPDANQLVPLAANLTVSANDPQRGGERIGTPLFGFISQIPGFNGGNATVRPEHSTSYTAGFILTPQQIPNLRISMDWTQITKRDNYYPLNTLIVPNLSGPNTAGQALFEQVLAAFPERFVRSGAPGAFSVAPITSIDGTVVNLAGSKVGAIDFALDYSTKLGGGTLDFSGSATWTYLFDVQVAANTPVNHWAGVGGGLFLGGATNGGLEWRGQATIRYSTERWSLGTRGHFFGAFYGTPNHDFIPQLGSSKIPAQIYFDLFGSYRRLSNTELSAGARNVFNTKPPYDTSTLGYSQVGDPRRGTWYVSISQKF